MRRLDISNNTVGEISQFAKLLGGEDWGQKGSNRGIRIRGTRLRYMKNRGKLVFAGDDNEVGTLAGINTNFIETSQKE